MSQPPMLSQFVAANVRAEMAAQKRTAVHLADLLGIKHQSALRRLSGDIPFSLGEVEKVATWLNVSETSFMAQRQIPEPEAVAS